MLHEVLRNREPADGISTPLGGVSWQSSDLEVSAARRVIAFLEDRRVLYAPEEMEMPEHCVRSVLEIRHFLSGELGKLDAKSDPASAVRMVNTEKPHQGIVPEKSALLLGQPVCNSTTALGLRGLAALDRVRSRCTGKERDSESGLDNFGARYDATSLGRFMTPDWAAKPATVPYANFGDPQTLNLYAYIENAPVNRVDLDGHIAPNICGIGGMACKPLHSVFIQFLD